MAPGLKEAADGGMENGESINQTGWKPINAFL
jgi:hypothetical protein